MVRLFMPQANKGTLIKMASLVVSIFLQIAEQGLSAS